jgi:hypothetical protein
VSLPRCAARQLDAGFAFTLTSSVQETSCSSLSSARSAPSAAASRPSSSGGIISSTLLVVLPALYRMAHGAGDAVEP